MAEPVLLNTSALLAYLHRETGFEVVRQAVRGGAAIGAVNLAEVLGKVREKGRDAAKINTALGPLSPAVLLIEVEDAALALYRSPLLPGSQAPVVEELRAMLRVEMTRVGIASGDTKHILPLAELQKDDTEVWKQQQRLCIKARCTGF